MLQRWLALILTLTLWLHAVHAAPSPPDAAKSKVEKKDFTVSLFMRDQKFEEAVAANDKKFFHWTVNVSPTASDGSVVDAFDVTDGAYIREGYKDSTKSNPELKKFAFQYKYDVNPSKANTLQGRIRIGSAKTSTQKVLEILKKVQIPSACQAENCVDWAESAIGRLQEAKLVSKFDVQSFSQNALQYGFKRYRNIMTGEKRLSNKQMLKEMMVIADLKKDGTIKQPCGATSCRISKRELYDQELEANTITTTEGEGLNCKKSKSKKPNSTLLDPSLKGQFRGKSPIAETENQVQTKNLVEYIGHILAAANEFIIKVEVTIFENYVPLVPKIIDNYKKEKEAKKVADHKEDSLEFFEHMLTEPIKGFAGMLHSFAQDYIPGEKQVEKELLEKQPDKPPENQNKPSSSDAGPVFKVRFCQNDGGAPPCTLMNAPQNQCGKAIGIGKNFKASSPRQIDLVRLEQTDSGIHEFNDRIAAFKSERTAPSAEAAA
ncbi:hypothetical protein QQS21_003160 [Conoideocrella luteorostrata]|uniref:Uncharacterized protein n=1 Tax=Conoideocrella luteorostrata TaxID=1105319 RepID=A0AAJ0FVV2_9HYPO|nr:hypothetical protein QQS21_003160 [Conoideocrella luteorostrata]